MDGAHFDFLTADRFSALGEVPVLVVDAADWTRPVPAIQAVVIGVDRAAALPVVDPADFDLLLTSEDDAPAPWVSIPAVRLEAHVDGLAAAVADWPMAATMLCRVLRLGEGLAFADAVAVESMAYSARLGGSEFARWRAGQAEQAGSASAEPLVMVERDGDLVTLTLNNPHAQNAITATTRDALYAALANVLDDPSEPRVRLQGAGRCFSTGGALEEFGSATDLAEAHIIRMMRSPAVLLNRLGERASVRLHGACVGSGLEIPAAAAHRIATPDAWFQLPELRMGLIPGAGGTASVARAIGRHRTAWMVLSGKRIDARRALDWGLIHEIAP
jgi:Enoyl-CoA hydratase/isomerase